MDCLYELWHWRQVKSELNHGRRRASKGRCEHGTVGKPLVLLRERSALRLEPLLAAGLSGDTRCLVDYKLYLVLFAPGLQLDLQCGP